MSHRRFVLVGLLVAVVEAVAFGACAVEAVAASVSVFPIPGSRYSRPATQISFRGVSRGAIGRVSVVGSRSGVHRGRMVTDSDGEGASFLPDKPFAVGETVTVSTGLNVLGARNGRFSFAIANVAPLIPNGKLGGIPMAGPHGVMGFHSRPDLRPASVIVTQDAAAAWGGDIFLAPQNGPVQDGPMILDRRGQLLWFMPYPVSKNMFVNDFRVQDLHGQPVLTWWQGFRNTGFGQSRGVGVIFNSHYRKIATVKAANGLDAGSHEFLLTAQGEAYITASSPVRLPVTRNPTIDSVVQEIDIKTGLVLFEWHALDHLPLSASYLNTASSGASFDPYHVNSVSIARDGNLLVSMRNTSAVYKIDHRNGRVLWTLGGKRSSFRMGPGTRTWEQHDAVVQPDGTLTIFDNGGGLPFMHPQSRGIRERLDLRKMTATLIREYDHHPPVDTSVEGGMQLLPGGDGFIGWGAQRFFSEYNASGQQVFNAHFAAPIASYRAYRFTWNAQPRTSPALAVSANADGTSDLYASWNGATDVSSWRVLAGSATRSLVPVSSVPKDGFESAILVNSAGPYFAVQALGVNGQLLSTSPAIAIRALRAASARRLAVQVSTRGLGREHRNRPRSDPALHHSHGIGAILAGMVNATPCRVKTRKSAGPTVIATAGGEFVDVSALGVTCAPSWLPAGWTPGSCRGGEREGHVYPTDGNATANADVALVRKCQDRPIRLAGRWSCW